MPFISANSNDQTENANENIDFVTETQLQVIEAYNGISDRLLPTPLPIACLKCGKPAEKHLKANLDSQVFFCTLQLPVCDRCANRHPFSALEFNRLAVVVSAVFLLAVLLAFISMILAVSIAGGLLMASLLLVRPSPFLSRSKREKALLELLRGSTRYERLVRSVEDARIELPSSDASSSFSQVRERASLMESFKWHITFRWLLCDHDFGADIASIPVLSSFLESLVDSMTEFAAANRKGREIAVRAHIELQVGRKRTVGLDVMPNVSADKVAKLLQQIGTLPDVVLNGPIVIHLYYATNANTVLFSKLKGAPLSDEMQEIVKRSQENEIDGSSSDQAESDSPEQVSIDDLLAWHRAAPKQIHLLSFLADRFIDLERTAEGLELWENYMQHAEDNSTARFQFAVFLERAGYLERAASICQRTIELEPDNTDAFGMLAHLQLQLDQPEHAATAVEKAPLEGRTMEFLITAARVYHALKDKTQVWKVLEELKERFPDTAATWYMRALTLGQQEKYREALDEVDELEKCGGSEWTVTQLRSNLWYQLGESQRAFDIVTAAIEKNSNDLPLRLLRAEYYYGVGKYELAIEDCLFAIEKVPEYAYAHQVLAAVYLENGDYDAAILSGQKAIELSESSSYLLGVLGAAHLMKQEEELAESYLIQACEADPGNIQARYRLSQLRANQGDLERAVEELDTILAENPDQPTVLMTRGYNYLSLREYEKADADFTQLLILTPKSSAGLRGKAIALEVLGKRREALSFYDQALEIDPEDSESLVGRSRLRMAENDMSAAEKDLNSVLESMPDSVQALYMRAQINMHVGKLDQAIDDFNEILKNNPEFTPALIGRSAVWNQKGEIEKSKEDLNAAIQSAPEQAGESDYSRLLQIAHLAFVQERYEESIAAANEAIATSDDHSHAIRIRAGAYWYSDQFAEALEDYDRLIKQQETLDPGLYNGRGQVYCELGEFDMALIDLEKGVELARQGERGAVLAYTLNGLGKTLTGLGRYDEAQAAFDESFELQPKNAWLQFNQALLAVVRNQPEPAVEFFKRALELTEPALSPKKRAKAKAYIDRYAGGHS
jgi:tetratricopeptide (TPR) repeat protein